MNSLRVLAAFALLTPLPAEATFTDFEDLVLSTSYPVGGNFTSKGITFDVVNFNGTGSNVLVGNGGFAAGSGLELLLGDMIGLDFQLPANTTEISFKYGEFCCNSGVEINGVMNVPVGGLVSLDGMTIGGATVSATSSGASNDQGMFTVSGNLTSFIVGGTEVGIDDVNIVVPEPSTALLGALALLTLITGRASRLAVA